MKSIIRTVAVMGIVACSAVMGLVGCSQQEAVEEEPAIEEQPSYDLVIGAEGDSVVDLPIKNDTEQSIVGIQFKSMDAAEYSANIMAEGQVWEAGQVADIFFEGVVVAEGAALPEGESNAAQGEIAGADDEAASDVLLFTDVYDLQLTTVDGGVIVLHQMNLAGLVGMQDMAVKYDVASGLGYLIYQDDGSEVSTLESEQRVAAEQAQAEAEAAAAEAAEAEASAKAEQQAQASRSASGRNSGSYDSVSLGSGSGGSVPSQSEDACINPDDLALN